MKFIRSTLFIINIGFALLLLISYLSPYISPLASKYIPILGLLYPAIFTINLAFFIFWVFSKWTYSLVSFCALIIGFSAITRFVSFNTPKVIKSNNLITLASYNLAKGSKLNKSDKNEFYDLLGKDFDHDVIFVQESNNNIVRQVKSRLQYKEIVHFEGKNTLIITDHKILNSGPIDFGTRDNSAVWADISFNGKKVRLYSVHLASNNVTRIADDVRTGGELVEKETWGNVVTMMRRYNHSTKKRLEQVEKILKHSSTIDYPIVIGGDFNDVPQSYVYAQMTKGLLDAFTEKGNGMGTSFNGSIPSLRIDYLFVSDHFSVLNFNTRKEKYSDHYPIETELILRTK
jgi:endonuclease/exonuclease/phosphatase family metal-dependent hydrolase